MVFGSSFLCQKWCQSQLSDFVAVQLFRGSCVRTHPRVKKAISLLQSAPTLSVLQSMGASKFDHAKAIQYVHHFLFSQIYFDGQKI